MTLQTHWGLQGGRMREGVPFTRSSRGDLVRKSPTQRPERVGDGHLHKRIARHQCGMGRLASKARIAGCNVPSRLMGFRA